MDSHNSDGSRAATTRAGFMALFAIVLAMGLGLAARPAAAAPFAYVVNNGDNTVSVIDTVGAVPTGIVSPTELTAVSITETEPMENAAFVT